MVRHLTSVHGVSEEQCNSLENRFARREIAKEVPDDEVPPDWEIQEEPTQH